MGEEGTDKAPAPAYEQSTRTAPPIYSADDDSDSDERDADQVPLSTIQRGKKRATLPLPARMRN